MSDQISLFEPDERTTVNVREIRTFTRTVNQLLSYQSAIREAILNNEKRIKLAENVEVADVYRSIVKNYEEELRYLQNLVWERGE